MSEKNPHKNNNFTLILVKITFETARIHPGVILFALLKDIKSENFLCIVG